MQFADGSNDSYLGQMWLGANSWQGNCPSVIFRPSSCRLDLGSTLSSEGKKKVIPESHDSPEGKLTMSRVSEAVRVLGANFFQDMTGQKKGNKTKVYSGDVLVTQDFEGEPTFQVNGEQDEDEFFEGLRREDDDAGVQDLASASSACAQALVGEVQESWVLCYISFIVQSSASKGRGFQSKVSGKGIKPIVQSVACRIEF